MVNSFKFLTTLLFSLCKGIIASPLYWALAVPLFVQVPYALTLRQNELVISQLEAAAVYLVLLSAFLSIVCQTLNVYEILHVDHLPVTRTFRMTLLGRLAAVISVLPWLYLYALLVCYLSHQETLLLRWEVQALILSSMAAALGWKIGLPFSISPLAFLTRLGVKPYISLILTAIIALLSVLEFFSRLAGRLLRVRTLFLAKAPVTILNPLFTVAAALPTVAALAAIASPLLREVGDCARVRLTPLSLKLSLVWNETQILECPAKLASPEFLIMLSLVGSGVAVLSFIVLPLSLAGIRYVDGRLWPLFYLRGAQLKWFVIQLAFNAVYALATYMASFRVLEIVGVAEAEGVLHAFSIVLLVVVALAPSIDGRGLAALTAVLVPLSLASFLLFNTPEIADLLGRVDGRLLLLASVFLSLGMYAVWFKVRAWMEG